MNVLEEHLLNIPLINSINIRKKPTGYMMSIKNKTGQ